MSRLQEARELLAATEGHTPGPWVDADNGRTIVVKDSRRHDLVFRVASLNPGCSLTANEAAANQQLTAAAPALRELLAAMVAEVEALDELAVEFDGGEITELNQAWPTWQRAMARYRAAHPCSGAYCTDRNCAGDQEELS